MVTFRNNNNRRNNFRRTDRNFKTNGDRQKFGSNFSTNDNFKRKAPGRNNHNAPKLIEKYNDLAREALSNGDKILSENYLQHADHFTRILNDRENFKKDKLVDNKNQIDLTAKKQNNEVLDNTFKIDTVESINKEDEIIDKEKNKKEITEPLVDIN
tara:strand:+ start:1551 stop:2018 length:468 start_codon:yes stop_codon:yes gene_type:complete